MYLLKFLRKDCQYARRLSPIVSNSRKSKNSENGCSTVWPSRQCHRRGSEAKRKEEEKKPYRGNTKYNYNRSLIESMSLQNQKVVAKPKGFLLVKLIYTHIFWQI